MATEESEGLKISFRAKGYRLMLIDRLDRAAVALGVDRTEGLFRVLEIGIEELERQAEQFKRWEARQRRAAAKKKPG